MAVAPMKLKGDGGIWEETKTLSNYVNMLGKQVHDLRQEVADLKQILDNPKIKEILGK